MGVTPRQYASALGMIVGVIVVPTLGVILMSAGQVIMGIIMRMGRVKIVVMVMLPARGAMTVGVFRDRNRFGLERVRFTNSGTEANLLAISVGGIFTGQGTDPNTGPLLALLALAFWPFRMLDRQAPDAAVI